MPEFNPAKKALGQNFLHDKQVIERIVAAISPKSDDIVVEIGPGRGALTDLLLASECNLHLIEYDYALAEYWQQQAQHRDKLTVHQDNVLKVDFNALAPGQTIKVIGNLPYNISSQILINLLTATQLKDSVVMLQLEMVDRIVASPNNKTYGRLSVMLQQHFYCEKLFKVPSGAFNPAPKVDSAILRLTPKGSGNVLKNPSRFAEIVKAAFAQRRKTLRNNLKKVLTVEQIQSVGIDPGLRAENLNVDDFLALASIDDCVNILKK